MNEGPCTACGVIENCPVRKPEVGQCADGVFQAERRIGTIQVCCFTKAYARYAEYIVPGAAVTIEGKCAIKQNGDDEEEKELYVSKMSDLQKTKRTIVVSGQGPDRLERAASYPIVEAHRGADYNVAVYDCMLGELRKCDSSITVNAAICRTNLDVRVIDSH